MHPLHDCLYLGDMIVNGDALRLLAFLGIFTDIRGFRPGKGKQSDENAHDVWIIVVVEFVMY